MTDASRILLVDDDADLRRMLSIRLQREGFNVKNADSGTEALALLPAFSPHLVITDMRMEGMDGMALFDAIHRTSPTLPVIVLTAHGTIPDAVEATERGVFAYLTKPVERDQLVGVIGRALKVFGGSDQNSEAEADWCKDIVTKSSVLRALLSEAFLVAKSSSSVLIRGESGTGKELVARAIHNASARADKAMIAVNCTAIPEQLFEAELFGHSKGAFTGATQARKGLILAAHGGTLFLDEIGDMPLPFQAKLLRVLQEKEIRPVGSTEAIPIDVRVISATHQDLELAIEEHTFREDLYYRLNVVALEIPPLSQRREDIPLLADHLLDLAREQIQEQTVDISGFSKEAIELMIAAPWPGNVRQLRNVVEQCAVLTTTPLIPANLVQRALRHKEKEFLPFSEARDRFELQYLTHLLEMTAGNVAQASRLAERNRSEFYKLLHRHGLDPEDFREAEPSGG